MSRKTKRLFTAIGLVVLMIAIGVLYVLVPKGKEESTDGDEQTATEEISVTTIDSEQINYLSMKADGETVILIKEEDTWKFQDDKKLPVNTELVDTMLSSVAKVTATQELERNEDSLKEYGLESPSLEVTAKTSDGKDYEFLLGIEVPVVGGYYGIAPESDKIYAINAAFYSAFMQTKDTLVKTDTAPEITAGYITHVTVENKAGKNFEAAIVPESERVLDTSEWNITQPYKNPVAVNVNTFSTLLQTYVSYAFEECESYKGSNLKKYGLDNPSAVITLKYYTKKNENESSEESTDNTVPEKEREYHDFKLLIGKKNKAGSYYVKMNHSDSIFTMSEEAVKGYIEPDVFTYIDHSIYAVLATEVKGYEVYIGDKKLSVVRKSTGEKNEDGVEQNEWYMNGTRIKTADEDTFLTAYSKMFLLELSGQIKSSVKPISDKAVLKFVYHENKRDVTIKYLPYDGTNFYRVEKDGVTMFLTDKRAVDDTKKAFQDLPKLIK